MALWKPVKTKTEAEWRRAVLAFYQTHVDEHRSLGPEFRPCLDAVVAAAWTQVEIENCVPEHVRMLCTWPIHSWRSATRTVPKIKALMQEVVRAWTFLEDWKRAVPAADHESALRTVATITTFTKENVFRAWPLYGAWCTITDFQGKGASPGRQRAKLLTKFSEWSKKFHNLSPLTKQFVRGLKDLQYEDWNKESIEKKVSLASMWLRTDADRMPKWKLSSCMWFAAFRWAQDFDKFPKDDQEALGVIWNGLSNDDFEKPGAVQDQLPRTALWIETTGIGARAYTRKYWFRQGCDACKKLPKYTQEVLAIRAKLLQLSSDVLETPARLYAAIPTSVLWKTNNRKPSTWTLRQHYWKEARTHLQSADLQSNDGLRLRGAVLTLPDDALRNRDTLVEAMPEAVAFQLRFQLSGNVFLARKMVLDAVRAYVAALDRMNAAHRVCHDKLIALTPDQRRHTPTLLQVTPWTYEHELPPSLDTATDIELVTTISVRLREHFAKAAKPVFDEYNPDCTMPLEDLKEQARLRGITATVGVPVDNLRRRILKKDLPYAQEATKARTDHLAIQGCGGHHCSTDEEAVNWMSDIPW